MDIQSEEDLISLKELSYALAVDSTTIRRWVKAGKIPTDSYQYFGRRSGYYFRRDYIEQFRALFSIGTDPDTDNEWRQAFVNFARSHHLTKSYKPVVLRAIFKLVDREGIVRMEYLVREFREFYIQRASAGLPVEVGVPLLQNITTTSDSDLKDLIVKYPLDRFVIKKFLRYYPHEGVLQVTPQLWRALRYYEVLEILESAEEQLCYYYDRVTREANQENES